MKNYLFSLLLLLSLEHAACDICGNFMGITPYDNQSQLSLMHRYRVFNGYRTYQQTSRFFIPGAYRTQHDPNALPGAGDSMVVRPHSSYDYEAYKVFELRGKYFLHPRIELNAILPVQQVKTRYNDVKTTTQTGLVDPSFFAGFHVLKRLNGYSVRQRLILGAGLKLPMGDYQQENAQSRRMNLLTQNGTGSWDHFYYVNYLVSHSWWGVSSNSLFKINGKNKFNERLADSYNQVFSVFARFTVKNVSVFPALLASYEYSRGLYTGGHRDPDTAMNLLLAGPSLDLSYKQVALNLSYQFNAYERVSSQSLSASGRVVIGLTFNFNQEHYLVRS